MYFNDLLEDFFPFLNWICEIPSWGQLVDDYDLQFD
jgi:hypothetical protein